MMQLGPKSSVLNLFHQELFYFKFAYGSVIYNDYDIILAGFVIIEELNS